MGQGLQVIGNNGVLLDTDMTNIHYAGDFKFYDSTPTLQKTTGSGASLTTGQTGHTNHVVTYHYSGCSSVESVYPFYVPAQDEVFTIHSITLKNNIIKVVLVTSRNVSAANAGRLLMFTKVSNLLNYESLAYSSGVYYGLITKNSDGKVNFDSRLEPLKLMFRNNITVTPPECVADYDNNDFTPNSKDILLNPGNATGLFIFTNGYGVKNKLNSWTHTFTCWTQKVLGVTVASKKQSTAYATKHLTYYKLGVKFNSNGLWYKYLNYVDSASKASVSSGCEFHIGGWLGDKIEKLDNWLRKNDISLFKDVLLRADEYPPAGYQPFSNDTSYNNFNTAVLGIRAEDYVNYGEDILGARLTFLTTGTYGSFNVEADADTSIVIPSQFTSSVSIEAISNNVDLTKLSIINDNGTLRLKYYNDPLSDSFTAFINRKYDIIKLVDNTYVSYVTINAPAALDIPDELYINGVPASTFCYNSINDNYYLGSIAGQPSMHTLVFTAHKCAVSDISLVVSNLLTDRSIDYFVENVDGVSYKFRVTITVSAVSAVGQLVLNKYITLKIKNKYYGLFNDNFVDTSIDSNNHGTVTSTSYTLKARNAYATDRGLFQHRAFPKTFMFNGQFADEVKIYDLYQGSLLAEGSLQNISRQLQVDDNTRPVRLAYRFADTVSGVSYTSGQYGATYSGVFTGTYTMAMDLKETITVMDSDMDVYEIPDEIVYQSKLSNVNKWPLYTNTDFPKIGNIGINRVITKNKIISGSALSGSVINMNSKFGEVIVSEMVDGTERYYHYDGTDTSNALTESFILSKCYTDWYDTLLDPVLTFDLKCINHNNAAVVEIDDRRILDIFSMPSASITTVSVLKTSDTPTINITYIEGSYSRSIHEITVANGVTSTNYWVRYTVSINGTIKYCSALIILNMVISSYVEAPVNIFNSVIESGSSRIAATAGTVHPIIYGYYTPNTNVALFYENKYIMRTITDSVTGKYEFMCEIPTELDLYKVFNICFYSQDNSLAIVQPFLYKALKTNKVLLNIYTGITATVSTNGYTYTFLPDGSATIEFTITRAYTAAITSTVLDGGSTGISSLVSNNGGNIRLIVTIPSTGKTELVYVQILSNSKPIYTECISALGHILKA